MKLSTRSRYGTRILLELARNAGKAPVQVSEKEATSVLYKSLDTITIADLIC